MTILIELSKEITDPLHNELIRIFNRAFETLLTFCPQTLPVPECDAEFGLFTYGDESYFAVNSLRETLEPIFRHYPHMVIFIDQLLAPRDFDPDDLLSLYHMYYPQIIHSPQVALDYRAPEVVRHLFQMLYRGAVPPDETVQHLLCFVSRTNLDKTIRDCEIVKYGHTITAVSHHQTYY